MKIIQFTNVPLLNPGLLNTFCLTTKAFRKFKEVTFYDPTLFKNTFESLKDRHVFRLELDCG